MRQLPYAVVADETPKATEALNELSKHYQFLDHRSDLKMAEGIVALGGDGFMLQTLHRFMKRNLPIYGMNCGTVGFLMNRFSVENLAERLVAAKPNVLRPLRMFVQTVDGKQHQALGINEVSLHRQVRQAAKIRVVIDHVVRLQELVCDGVLVATPGGSTAYNLSANGPILPIGSGMLALTPISPFRPRHWRGAILPDNVTIHFDVMDPEHRPVSAVADFTEIRNVAAVEVGVDPRRQMTLLFDMEHNLEERILKEQFLSGVTI